MSSTCDSGTSRIPNSGEKTTHSAADHIPSAHTSTVARKPIQVPSAPPVKPPSGSVPHTRNRTDAFMRPSSGRGQIACRYDTCALL
jgi:hypothetical protein